MDNLKRIHNVILMLLLISCSSCASFRYCACNNTMTDKDITTNVQVRIASDTGLADLNINVSTYNRVVTLEGCVENPTQMRIALAKAASIPCVKYVVSRLTIKHFY